MTHAVLGNGTITITNPTAQVQDIATISHDVNNAQVILEENHQHGTLSFPTSMLTDPGGTMQHIGNGIANSDVLIDAVGQDIQQAPEHIADSIANATDWIKTTFDPINIPESTSITLTSNGVPVDESDAEKLDPSKILESNQGKNTKEIPVSKDLDAAFQNAIAAKDPNFVIDPNTPLTYALSEDGKSVTVIVGQGDGAVIPIELPISPTAAAALARHPATLTILGAVALGIYVYNHQEQIYEFTDEVNDAIAQGITDFYGDTETKPKPKPPADTKGTHEIDPDDFDDQLPDGPDNNNQNDVNHVFGDKKIAEHQLEDFLDSFSGNKNAAYNAIQEAVQQQANAGEIYGLYKTQVNIGGFNITVRGNVINGIAKIGTAFIP